MSATASTRPAAEHATLYEHCRRALERGATAGAHGLPLMGSGDWNDGMNRVGAEGRGESVWLGWFLHATLSRFAALCERRGDAGQAAAYRAASGGAAGRRWSATAGMASGTCAPSTTTAPRWAPAQNAECQIDAIAQSWAVLSGAGDPDRVGAGHGCGSPAPGARGRPPASALHPALRQDAARPRLHQGLPAGHPRERRPIHARGAVDRLGLCRAGPNGDGGKRSSGCSTPSTTPTRQQQWSATRSSRMSSPPTSTASLRTPGRGGWTWYTGSAAWMYRLGLEGILGLRRVGGGCSSCRASPPIGPATKRPIAMAHDLPHSGLQRRARMELARLT